MQNLIMPLLHRYRDPLALLGLSIIFFAVSLLARPLMPIDETRYMTVAWEMYLNKKYFLLTLNGAPYHHKPPMLFWLINLCWQVFGVSRWAAMLPIFAAFMAMLALTRSLARRVMPDQPNIMQAAPWVLLGMLAFLIYSSLVMFDALLSVCVLGAAIFTLDHARYGKVWRLIAIGLLAGLGVLIKGPVAYLHILPAMILAWCFIGDRKPWPILLGRVGIVILVSALPVLAWLAPLVMQADDHFLTWLLWNQTAGRITGNFSAAHVKPLYFYVMLLPVVFVPWLFLPSFWRQNLDSLRQQFWKAPGSKFLTLWIASVFIAFSVITGKQAHYLLPLLPGFAIITASLLLRTENRKRLIRRVCVGMIAFACIAQAIAAFTFFPRYDLEDLAREIRAHHDVSWAFVDNYHGEFGFLGRLEKPVADIQADALQAWFAANPGGYAVVKYRNPQDFARFCQVSTRGYRGRNLGVIKEKCPVVTHH